MTKKYELIPYGQVNGGEQARLETAKPYFRIRALRAFLSSTIGHVQEGQLGGIVSGEYNLSQEGNCWIDFDSFALEESRVKGGATLQTASRMYGTSILEHSAVVTKAFLYGNSRIRNEARVVMSHLTDTTVGGACEVVHATMGKTKLLGKVVIIGKQEYHIVVGPDVRLEGTVTLEGKTEIKNFSLSVPHKRGLVIKDAIIDCEAAYHDYIVFGGNAYA